MTRKDGRIYSRGFVGDAVYSIEKNPQYKYTYNDKTDVYPPTTTLTISDGHDSAIYIGDITPVVFQQLRELIKKLEVACLADLPEIEQKVIQNDNN